MSFFFHVKLELSFIVGKGSVKLKILEKFCHNFSIKVNYSLPVPKDSKTQARIYVCETGMGLELCGTHLGDYTRFKVRGYG